MLQCGAVRCNVLQCVAVWCCVVLRGAVCYRVLHCGAVCCSVMQCVAVCCSVVLRVATWCSVLHHVAGCYSLSIADVRAAQVYCSVLQCVTMCCIALSADFRAVQELADRVILTLASFDARASNSSTMQTSREEVSVPRVAFLPNEFDVVRKMPLFNEGSESSALIAEVASTLKTLLFSDAACIIRAGTTGMGMYFVNHGVCSARVQGAEVANMEHGDFFGEIALTLSCTRTADVYAQGTVELFEFARKDFKTIVAKYPYLLQKLKQTARARVKNAVAPRAAIVDSNDDAMQQQVYAGGAVSHQDGYDDKAVQPSTLLKLRSLFNLGSGETAEDGMLIKVSALAWADIVASMTRVRVEKDEIVMSRQAPPGGLYIVEDGQVELLTHGVAVETMSAGV